MSRRRARLLDLNTGEKTPGDSNLSDDGSLRDKDLDSAGAISSEQLSNLGRGRALGLLTDAFSGLSSSRRDCSNLRIFDDNKTLITAPSSSRGRARLLESLFSEPSGSASTPSKTPRESLSIEEAQQKQFALSKEESNLLKYPASVHDTYGTPVEGLSSTGKRLSYSRIFKDDEAGACAPTSGSGRARLFESLISESSISASTSLKSPQDSQSTNKDGKQKELVLSKEESNSLKFHKNILGTYETSVRGLSSAEKGHSYSRIFENDKTKAGAPTSSRSRAKILESLISDSSISVSTSSKAPPKSQTINKEAQQEGFTESKDEISDFFRSLSHGTYGTPVRLACNYIRLKSDPQKGVYVYEVRFVPNVDSNNLRMKYLNEHREKFGGTKTFDGVSLYLPILLKDKLTTFVSRNQADGTEIEIRILFKRREILKNCIHLYNVLFDRIMKTLNYVRFDRKQFDPTSPKIIPQQKLEIWPGYITAVDEYEGGLMLCCDVSHRLLCQKTVLEMMTDIYMGDPHNFQENAKKSLLGSVIITRYNNRTYRIDDICFDKDPMCTFTTKDGVISYNDYYLKNYNIVIRDKSQPLLISIKKQKLAKSQETEDIIFCLIPEICHLTGLRDDMRSDFRLMREIATFTRITPNQRLQALEKFYNNVNNCPEAAQILQDWGLTLDQSYEHVDGRCFQEEKVYFNQTSVSAGPNADFSNFACKNELLEVVHIHNWLLIHVKSNSKVAQTFCDLIERNSRPFGLTVQKPKIIVLQNDRVDTYVNALRNNITKECQIVVCITPTARDDRYSAIKKICCTEIPVPSQVINARTLCNETKNRSIVQKIMLQMNCKLGGTLWSIKIPLKNVIICGIDSYHDAAQNQNSVAAFVASMNSTYTKWYSKAIIQTKREEIVGGLSSSFIAALLAFHKVNGVYPDSAIIYRDGVGDGQLTLCENYEIPQFEAACQKILNRSLKLTFIVVQKRINTRYYTLSGSNAHNPLPGTVVDTDITRSNYYDFFMVSQSVRQGTVSPTHYVVLRDDSLYGPNIVQRITYKLCFLYYNWPGTIRIPACCQYAHKMAYLVGRSIQRSPAENLCHKLFYL